MKIGNLEVYGIIYKIFNKTNQKVYIGQTTSKNGFDRRYGKDIQHVYINTTNTHLKSSIKKYGYDNFGISKIIDLAFSQCELDIKEDTWIQLYNSTNSKYGYNKRGGGNGGKMSEETKRKMGKSRTGLYKGNKNPQYGLTGELSPNWGKKHSEETKNKISKSHKGKIISKELLEKMRKANTGRKNSDETKLKMSEIHKRLHLGEKKIMCLTTGKEFESAKKAANFYKISYTGLSQCCKGKSKSCGKTIDGTKMQWKYI